MHSCPKARSDLPSWRRLLEASAQNPFRLKTHGHDVVEEANEPGVAEKSQCFEERGSLGQGLLRARRNDEIPGCSSGAEHRVGVRHLAALLHVDVLPASG